MPRLRSLGDGAVVRFVRALRVGRSRRNDLVLAHETVSSAHALIEWRDGGWVLRDLGSRNGTGAAGRRIEAPTRLAEGDEIRFGPECRYVIEGLDESPEGTEAALPVARTAPALPTGPRLTLVSRGGLGDVLYEAADGAAPVVHRDQELRFSLLWVLAQHRIEEEQQEGRQQEGRQQEGRGGLPPEPGWMDDDLLKISIYGRRRAERLSAAALTKLIHDTRALLFSGVVEKKRGRTRLGMPAAAVVLREG